MKLAIMQPYIFPYIGYFQLINLVDKFVILDDVNYIKKGWINRNNILVQNEPNLFTIPLTKVSQFSKINETLINIELYTNWKIGFLKTLEYSYKKSPFFKNTIEIIKEILNQEINSISEYNFESLKYICNYINIDTKIEKSSIKYENSDLKSECRIIDICVKEQATEYYNPIGGIELYKKEIFLQNKIKLHFLKSKTIKYNQFTTNFESSLSIIDVLMFNSRDEIKEMLNQYEII